MPCLFAGTVVRGLRSAYRKGHTVQRHVIPLTASLSQHIITDIDRNLCYPVLKRSIPAKLLQALIRLDKSLLADVVQLVVIPDKPRSEPEYFLFISPDQF